MKKKCWEKVDTVFRVNIYLELKSGPHLVFSQPREKHLKTESHSLSNHSSSAVDTEAPTSHFSQGRNTVNILNLCLWPRGQRELECRALDTGYTLHCSNDTPHWRISYCLISTNWYNYPGLKNAQPGLCCSCRSYWCVINRRGCFKDVCPARPRT